MSNYYEPVAGFENISPMQAQFSAEVAQRISELDPNHTAVIIPLIGGIYQWWRLQEAAPKLVSELQPNAVFVAKNNAGMLKLSKDVARLPHVVVLDDIGDALTQFGEICELPGVECAKSVNFFSPVRKVHTLAKMEAFNAERQVRQLPKVDFFIPYYFPDDENGEAPWVCSGFGMNEGPDTTELTEENFPGSLPSLAVNQRMSTTCYKRKPGIAPRYSMEIQLFGFAARQGSPRERNRLIDLEACKGDWKQQFRMIQRWYSE